MGMSGCRLKLLWPMFVLFLLFSMLGCGTKEEKEAKHHKRAKEYIEKEEFKKAVIELKNVVQLNPQNDAAQCELGETYLKLKQPREAFQAFSRAVTINEDNLEAQLKTGQLLLLGKNSEDAQKKAVLILKKSPENIDALLLLAGIQILDQDFDAAMNTLKKANEIDPNNYKCQISMGRVFLLKKDMDQAKKAYLKAKAIDPAASVSYLSLARIYGFEKKWGQAESELKEMIQVSGSSRENLYELARFYESQKKWQQAEKIYLEAAESVSEKDIAPLITLGGFYSRRKTYDKALTAMQKAAALKKDDLNILVAIAQLYLEEKQIAEANDILDKILEKDGGHVEANFLKGRVHLMNKDFDNALPLFELTVRERPENAMAHYFKALCLLGKGDNNLARKGLLKAVELDSRLVDARLILAEFYLRERNQELARQQIEAALELDPDNFRVLMLNGNLKLLEKNPNEAEAAFTQVVNLRPDYAPGYIKLGLLYSITGKKEKALEFLNKALTLDPKRMEALAMAVGILTKSGEHERAIQLCEETKARSGEKPSLLSQIEYTQGTILLAKKDTVAARRHFEKAIAIDPNTLAAYVTLARLSIRENNMDAAISQYMALLEKDPKSLTGHMGLGTVYDLQGEGQKAEASYRKALEIKSDFGPAANNLAWNLMKRGGNIDEALGFAQIAKEQMPENPSVMDTLGWLYYLKGSYLNAITELQDSLEKQPDNPIINYHMGMAYYQNSQTGTAKQFLEKALKIDPDFSGAEEARSTIRQIDAASASS